MAHAQIHLLIGPNRYLLFEEAKRWKQAFREKHGDENLLQIEGKRTSMSDIATEACIAPFIADKRLIVLDGLPRAKKGDTQSIADVMHADVIVLFVHEADIGKRAKHTVATKDIMSIATVKECPALSSAQLVSWVCTQFQSEGKNCTPEKAQYIIKSVGEDQALLAQEIAKIALYVSSDTISQEEIECMLATSAEREAWKLMDILGEGKPEKALSYVYTLLDKGFSPHALWSTYLWMLSILVDICSFTDQGVTNPWDIAREIRANPTSVKAMIPYAKSLSVSSIRRIIKHAVEADIGLKTGKYKATAESPEELMALIDQSLLSFR